MSDVVSEAICEKAEAGSCSCAIADRVAAYNSLASLYRCDRESALSAVEVLRSAIRTCGAISYIDDDAVSRGFDDAVKSLEQAGGPEAYEDESLRLFGDCEGFDPFSHELSASEMTYVAVEPKTHAEHLRAIYDGVGFDLASSWPGDRCPGHIAAELAFIGFCLEQGMSGSDEHLDAARSFFAEHLSEWAVLFAVVTANKTRNPVMHLAGVALDKFLACESATFRHAIPSLCALRRSATA
jgi:hypothetical protein